MAKKANQQSETITVDQIDRIYKARPGYRVVPLEITDKLAIAYDPKDIKGIGWFWIDGKKKHCLLKEVPKKLGDKILTDLECEKGTLKLIKGIMTRVIRYPSKLLPNSARSSMQPVTLHQRQL